MGVAINAPPPAKTRRFELRGQPPTWYGVDEGHLARIEHAAESGWKDIFFAALPLGIALFLNAAAGSFDNKGRFCLPLLASSAGLNLIFGIVAITVALVSVIAWLLTREKLTTVLDEIRNQPKL